MWRVFVTDSGGLDFAPGLAALRYAGHEAELLEASSAAEVAARASGADALIVSFVEVDAVTIAALPELKAIATTTVGVNQIDLPAVRAAGVVVSNLPSLASEEVATHALAGMLALLRELPAAQAAAGDWDFTRIPAPPRISELTLGVYGMGRIAQQLVARALPLFARVVGYDPFTPDEHWPAGVERLDESDAVFRAADVVSLHAPATPDTLHAVNARTIELMPEGGYIVNVSRGDLVDGPALVAALDSGRLRGAFLDVLEGEPPRADDPLLRHPRAIVTPHSAFYSAATGRDYVMTAVQNVLDVLAGRTPATTVA
jgi:phosphoglycerate dehydrogenase-like enzyme